MLVTCGRGRPAQFTAAWRQARWHHGFVIQAQAMVFNRLLLFLVPVGARELGGGAGNRRYAEEPSQSAEMS